MNSNEYKKLAQYQSEVARLQKSLAKYNQKLLALPAKHGFKTMNAFIDALRDAAGAGGKGSKGKGVKTAKGGKKRKRVTITPEIKAKVKALLADKKTGAQVAKAIGISLPSVQNIKKELGMVKKRKA